MPPLFLLDPCNFKPSLEISADVDPGTESVVAITKQSLRRWGRHYNQDLSHIDSSGVIAGNLKLYRADTRRIRGRGTTNWPRSHNAALYRAERDIGLYGITSHRRFVLPCLAVHCQGQQELPSIVHKVSLKKEVREGEADSALSQLGGSRTHRGSWYGGQWISRVLDWLKNCKRPGDRHQLKRH